MDNTTTTTQDCSSPSSVNMNNNNNNNNTTTVDDSCNDPGKMFIGGLSWQTSQESLKAYFEKYGEVKEAMVLKDPATKRSRGFGFVTYKDPSSVDRVLSNGPHCLDSKTVDPKVAVPRKTHPKHVTKTKKIFVGGLSNQTTIDDVKNYFRKYGTIEDAQIMMDRTTNRSRGFAFVTFSSEEVVDAVCDLHFHDINSKMVEAKKAQPKEVMAATSGPLTRGRGIAQRYVSAPYSIPQGTSVTGFLPAAAAAAASYPALPAAYGRSYGPPIAPGYFYPGSASQMDLAYGHPQQDHLTYIQVSTPQATSFATAPMAMPPALAISHNGVHAGAPNMAGMANGGIAGASANAPMAGLATHSGLPNGAIPAANGLTGLAGPGPLPVPPFSPFPFQYLPYPPYPLQRDGYQ